MELFDTTYLTESLFWTSLSFLILLGIMWKFVVPALSQVLEARAEQVSSDLTKAEQLRKDAQDLFAEYRTQLEKAQEEAAGIVQRAREQADAEAKQRTTELEAELQRKAEAAEKRLNAAQEQAVTELRAEAANLAIAMSEKILGESIDNAQAKKLSDAALKQLNS